MIILIQIVLFLGVFFVRRSYLFGWHLRETGKNSDVIGFRTSGRLARRHIGVWRKAGLPFVIRRETWYHRMLKALGLASEFHFGANDLDAKIFVVTDFPNHLDRIKTSTALVRDLEALFALPVKALHATPTRVWCVIDGPDVAQPDAYFADHIAILRQIAEHTGPEALVVDPSIKRRHTGAKALAMIGVHAGSLGVGLLGGFAGEGRSYHALLGPDPIAEGLVLGAGAAAIWLILLVVLLRATSYLPWVLTDFVICGLVGFLASGVVVMRDGNVAFPQTAATVHRVPVIATGCVLKCKTTCFMCRRRRSSVRTYRPPNEACVPDRRAAFQAAQARSNASCADNGRFEFSLLLDHWQLPTVFSVRVSEAMHDEVRRGTMMRVPVHPGAFGTPWIDEAAIETD